MRIAVLLEDRCQPANCQTECINYCPPNRTGSEVIVMGAKGKPIISESLCIGCGICINKCPFDAIRIISLPAELEQDMIQRYGLNGFRLFRLAFPRQGEVTGILGPNGIGKTTAFRILSGTELPNLGEYDTPPNWEKVIAGFRGTEGREYFRRLAERTLKVAIKPQYVDKIPKQFKGQVQTLLKRVDRHGRMAEVVERLELHNVLGRDLKQLSGGELQRVAIAATLMRDADVYLFDEPSSYLDIGQRLRVADLLETMLADKAVMIIEHDLAILDVMCDNVHIIYGDEGAFGVITHPQKVRGAINTYLEGYLPDDNVRFRDHPIRFEPKPPRDTWAGVDMVAYTDLERHFDSFSLRVAAGTIRRGEVVGVVGANATGKTTFVQILAGVQQADEGEVTLLGEAAAAIGDDGLPAGLKVSYKPQYIAPEFQGTVQELFQSTLGFDFNKPFFTSEVSKPLQLERLFNHQVPTLSGGELQRVALGLALTRSCDLLLIDEPSAYLDSEMRMIAAKTIRRVVEKRGLTALVVEHDMYFLDLVADSVMVFSGEPSVAGKGEGPFPMREGMNRFLAMLDITFRRDPDTQRPRINKKGSRLDREQRERGEYYYA